MDEVRERILKRARVRRNPFKYSRIEEVESVLSRLTSVDRDKWAEAFSGLAKPYEEEAAQAEQAGDAARARENV